MGRGVRLLGHGDTPPIRSSVCPAPQAYPVPDAFTGANVHSAVLVDGKITMLVEYLLVGYPPWYCWQVIKEDSSSPAGWVFVFDLATAAPAAATASALVSASAPKAKAVAFGGAVGLVVAAALAMAAFGAIKIAKGRRVAAEATPNLV